MPAHLRTLDHTVATATLEGGPMTTLEAMASGVPVVIPKGVGIHDELPEVPGVYRYRRGDAEDLIAVLERALDEHATCDREALRGATRPHCVEAWCEATRIGFEDFLSTRSGTSSQHSVVKAGGGR